MIKANLLLIVVVLIFFIQERHLKLFFMRLADKTTEEDNCKRIFETISDGIMITEMKKTKTPEILFSNNSLKEILKIKNGITTTHAKQSKTTE
jgi:hypothetical protein